MAGRRLILFVVLLIVIGAVASAIAPRDGDRPSEGGGRRTVPPEPAGVPLAGNVVRASLPRRADVRARVGDVVQLAVSNGASDVVQVASLGIEEPVDPGLAAQVVFDADRPGRFAVTLRDTGTRLGTIDVRQAG